MFFQGHNRYRFFSEVMAWYTVWARIRAPLALGCTRSGKFSGIPDVGVCRSMIFTFFLRAVFLIAGMTP